MADRMQYAENDPRHHTAKLKQMLRTWLLMRGRMWGRFRTLRLRRCLKPRRKYCLAWKRLTRISKTEMSELGRAPQVDMDVP